MSSSTNLPPWVFIIVGISCCLLLLLIVWIICKCRQRYGIDYTALDEERSLLKKWEDEKRIQKNAERDAILLNCYYYLRNSSNYSIVNHLADIGSRIDKHWFIVQDSHSRTQKMLTMAQWSHQCVIPCNKQTKKTLTELFELISTHPYIFPVLNTDLMLEQKIVIMIRPFIEAGSLKDMIYCSHPKSSWLDKYDLKGKHLPDSKIKTYGRQILEALIYLQSKGLPQCKHLHTGNIFIVNGVCRISGYGSTLFGYKSRLETIVKSITKNNEDAFEVISFGHLLFEMAAGFELKTAQPDEDLFSKCRSQPVTEVLRYIFTKSGSYPYLEEIASRPFFKYVDVHIKNDKAKVSSSIKTMLKLYRKEMESSQRRRKKSEKRKSRGESLSDIKRERTKSRSKSKKSFGDGSLPAVAFSQSPTPPVLPPPILAPPPPLPPPSSNVLTERPPTSSSRAFLLADICKGSNLKKTPKINDRSAPRI